MTKTEALPVLAEAADVLSDQLGVLLKRLAGVLRPHVDRLEARYLTRLEQLNFNSLQSRALAQLTAGAAARILTRGEDTAAFFESVEYHAQRLAKLNVLPAAVVSALGEYDKLITPVLRKHSAEHKNFQWVRDQLHFCVMLTLNNAYYHVREAETQAFYEMFWAEVEARRLDELLSRFLETLARFCRADRARLYLSAGAGAPFELRGSYGSAPAAASPVSIPRLPRALMEQRSFYPGRSAKSLLIEREWAGDLARCWSVPMVSRKRVTGLIQFGFVKPYEWLPREQELLKAAAERCILAAEKARLLEDLSAREAQIRRLAERMMHVEESERRRISRELHDQSGQDLLWIRLQMEMLENSISDEAGQPWKSKLSEIRDMTEKTIVEIRRLIGALSPAVLEQLGLVPALRQLINRFRQNHTSRVRLQVGRMKPLPKQLEVIMYRLVQECLNNIGKHSFCSNVMISVSHADGNLRLCVEDDGVGFRVEDALNKPGSFGLAGIRERVALLGGSCEIESRMLDPVAESAPGAGKRQGRVRGAGQRGPQGGQRTAAPPSGTTVRVELPVPAAVAVEVG